MDAKSQPTSFEYDFTTGRLTKDSNAANGFKTLLKTPIAGGYRVDLTTALSRKTSYDVQRSAGNANIRNVTAPSGLVTNAIETSSGERTLTFPDDSTMRMKPVGDPRFGLQSPIMAFEETKSGTRTRTIERTREVTMNPNTPTELVEQIDRVKINGLTFKTTFTAALGKEDTETPEERHIFRYVDSSGRVIKEQVGNLAPIEYMYDSEGQLEQIVWGNRIWDLGYDASGHISSIVNPLLEMTQMGTDAVGRLTSETNPLSHVTSVGYDDNGNASSVTPAGQPLHGMTHTPLNQLETYTAPTVNGQPSQTNWTYDFDGDLDKVTLPDQSFVDHTRDNAGRPETIVLPGSEGTITLGYHPSTGHLTTLTGPQGVNLTLGYNGSLLTDQTFSDMTVSTIVHHDHDDFFRVVNETVNGLFPATFHYDADGLLDVAGGMTLGRNAQTGLLDGSSLGAVEDEYTRDPTHGEVTNYVTKANGAVIFDVATPRDGMGRIDSRTEIIGGQTTFVDYVYDAAGRLTDANGSQGSVHYDYDANGNRLGRTGPNGTESGTYDAQDRLKTYGGYEYEYTLRGSLARVEKLNDSSDKTLYSYDALGGLRQVVLPNMTNIEYEVDGAGRRVWKSRNGQREQGFVYADGLRPVAELNGLGQIVARFIYGRHINVPDIMIKNGRAYRIVTDHLGSPRFVVDTLLGTIVQTMTYDEYGRVTSDSMPGFQPFGFAGGIYDLDTKLVRFGARDYDAFTGRWTAKDPILWAGGQGNLYGYCWGDSINCHDPSGLDAEEWFFRNGDDLAIGVAAVSLAPITIYGLGSVGVSSYAVIASNARIAAGATFSAAVRPLLGRGVGGLLWRWPLRFLPLSPQIRDLLVRYRDIAQRAIDAGKDRQAVQAARRDFINRCLKD